MMVSEHVYYSVNTTKRLQRPKLTCITNTNIPMHEVHYPGRVNIAVCSIMAGFCSERSAYYSDVLSDQE